MAVITRWNKKKLESYIGAILLVSPSSSPSPTVSERLLHPVYNSRKCLLLRRYCCQGRRFMHLVAHLQLERGPQTKLTLAPLQHCIDVKGFDLHGRLHIECLQRPLRNSGLRAQLNRLHAG